MASRAQLSGDSGLVGAMGKDYIGYEWRNQRAFRVGSGSGGGGGGGRRNVNSPAGYYGRNHIRGEHLEMT